MKHTALNIRNSSGYRFGVSLVVFFAVTLFLVLSPAGASTLHKKSFSSPDEAVKALMDAVKRHDEKEMIAIFGPGSKALISSGDRIADRESRDRFVKAYEEKNKLENEGERKMVLHVGKEDWPFPIPLAKKGNLWFFHTKEGKEEIINRRIGKNELNAVQVCFAYADAQREYALLDRDGDGLLAYAEKIVSEPGKKDGLYWEAQAGDKPSPLGPFVAAAREEGYGYTPVKAGDKPVPYHGYYYRILTAQGRNAPGGAYNYVVNGKMIGGFALVAYPARYGNSGIMTFISNQDGTVYQKNLGKDTKKIARTMELFDPDGTWKKME
jgi:hypothetical protein